MKQSRDLFIDIGTATATAIVIPIDITVNVVLTVILDIIAIAIAIATPLAIPIVLIIVVVVIRKILQDPFNKLPRYILSTESLTWLLSFPSWRSASSPPPLSDCARFSCCCCHLCLVSNWYHNWLVVAPGVVATAFCAKEEVADHIPSVGLGPDHRKIDPSLDAEKEPIHIHYHAVIITCHPIQREHYNDSKATQHDTVDKENSTKVYNQNIHPVPDTGPKTHQSFLDKAKHNPHRV